MNFPDTIKKLRTAKDLTQAAAADLLEISKSSLEKWEAGHCPHILTQEGALSRLRDYQKKKGGK